VQIQLGLFLRYIKNENQHYFISGLSRYTIIFLILIFPNLSIGQTLLLNIKTEKNTNSIIIDSIGYVKRFNNYNALENEINEMVNTLWRSGYIDTTIESIAKSNDSIFVANLSLGKQLKRIQIYYDNDFNSDLLKFINHKPGEGFFELDINGLENSLNELNSKIAELGDPFSSLQLIEIEKYNDLLISARLNIVSNQKRRIDNIVIKGYEKFPKSYLKWFFKITKRQILQFK
jgi:hypothetical protein